MENKFLEMAKKVWNVECSSANFGECGNQRGDGCDECDKLQQDAIVTALESVARERDADVYDPINLTECKVCLRFQPKDSCHTCKKHWAIKQLSEKEARIGADKVIKEGLYKDRKRLKEKIASLEARIKELDGDKKGLVMANALLRQRHDLPVDRIPAYKEFQDKITSLETEIKDRQDTEQSLTKWIDDLSQKLEKAVEVIHLSNEVLLASRVNCDIGEDGRKLINIRVAQNHKALKEIGEVGK